VLSSQPINALTALRDGRQAREVHGSAPTHIEWTILVFVVGTTIYVTRRQVLKCDVTTSARYTLPVFTGREHGPWTRPVNTGHGRGHGPCLRAVLVTSVSNTAREHGCSVHTIRVHGPCPRPVKDALVQGRNHWGVGGSAPPPKKKLDGPPQVF